MLDIDLIFLLVSGIKSIEIVTVSCRSGLIKSEEKLIRFFDFM